MSGANVFLRVEGAAIFVASTIAFGWLAANGGAGWGLFALLLLAPDLSMLGYLVNLRVGTVTYNIAHLLALPLLLGAIGFASGQTALLQVALIWSAHIGMDRIVGYGFKYATAFKDTHMQRV